jgi:hypothetical protein
MAFELPRCFRHIPTDHVGSGQDDFDGGSVEPPAAATGCIEERFQFMG